MGKIKTVRQFKGELLAVIFTACFVSGVALCYAGDIFRINSFLMFGKRCFILSFVLFVVPAVSWMKRNQIKKGFLYAWKHYTLVRRLRKGLLDAGLYTMIKFGTVELASIPWITVVFEPDFKSGTVSIENSLKFHEKLGKINISSALGKYVVEQVYLADNGDHYRFDFYDASLKRKLVFNSFNEFKRYSDSLEQYELFVDNYTNLTLTHQLLVGQTGSGKSYALMGYLLQMLLKKIPYHLYIADPKGADIAQLGELTVPDTTADTFEGIVALLEDFVSELYKRQRQIKTHLAKKLNRDYRDFGLSPYVLVFDEYADFSILLQTKDKKQRDRINHLISEIVLKGRQAGFFLWVVMQQAGSNNIPTFLRDNLPWKTVFGNAEEQTYVTAFGARAEIPQRKMGIGDGVYTYPSITHKPRLCSASTLGFDIVEALEAGVM